MEENRRPILWGLALIVIGALSLSNALGVTWLSMERLWPIWPIVGGVLALVNALRSEPREPGGVWFGTLAILCGLFFFYFTLGMGEWGEMSTLWPVFVLIAAFAWFVAWLFDRTQVSNLVAALIASVVAGLGVYWASGRLDESLGLRLLDWWPALLIVLGVGMIAQFLIRKK